MFPLKKNQLRNMFFYGVVLIVMIVVAVALYRHDGQPSFTYSDLKQLFEQERVESFTVQNNTITVKLRTDDGEDETYTYRLRDFSVFYDDMNDLVEDQWRRGIITSYNYPESVKFSAIAMIVPYLVILVVMGLVCYFLFFRQGGGGGVDRTAAKFSHARTKGVSDSASEVTFADVAGADEEKAELQEIVEFLRDPSRFTALGARIPKGVLLVGPPGTGKTLIAKAVAGEAGVQFLSISGSDFVELYVGVGASRVRDLFDQAKKESPAIVFIDEIDAVGRRRGAGLGGGHDEREQTLNQLLVEMDGFGSNEGVIVMAATNRQDILDPALLRPGRFDRQIYVGRPDIRGREEILKVHSRKKPLAEDISLREVAQSTAGFTGADLENLMNEAALLAARRKGLFITKEDLHEATLKVIAGPEKKSKVVTEQAKKLTAYHEAGHAVVIHAMKTQDPVHQITIIPRGMAGGMTISLPTEDRDFRSRTELEEEIAACLGGRVAEQLVLGDISTGAASDLQRASSIARAMVMKYGMSDKLGAITFDSEGNEVFIGRTMTQQRTYSEEVAGAIDVEVHAIIDKAYQRCMAVLNRYRAELEVTAQFLLRYETMSAEEFARVFTDPKGLALAKAAEEEERTERERAEAERAALLERQRNAKQPVEDDKEADEFDDLEELLAEDLKEHFQSLPLLQEENDEEDDDL